MKRLRTEPEPQPGPSREPGPSEENRNHSRKSLLKEIDQDIKRLLGKKVDDDEVGGAGPLVAEVRGRDGARYSLEIFMRTAGRGGRGGDRASKSDPRAPVVVDQAGAAHAVIPAGQRLLLLATRRAVQPRQRVPRGRYVLFKFYVDGEPLSDGCLHEASQSKPDTHWAKANISSQPVRDQQRVEFAHQANPDIGTFVVRVWTRLGKQNNQ